MASAAFTALKRGLAEVAGGVVVAPEKATRRPAPSLLLSAIIRFRPALVRPRPLASRKR